MKTSENISDITAALAKAQGAMQSATFDKVNPHFKSKYATLTSIMNSVKKPLSDNGLSVVQVLRNAEGGSLYVVTTLYHSSGQWIQDDGVPLILDKQNMQALGSAITYAKRYGISAMLAVVCDEDDDANAASTPSAPEIKNVTQVNSVSAPKNTAAVNGTPSCCGKPMMVSKFADKDFGVAPPWYCISCKNKVGREVVA